MKKHLKKAAFILSAVLLLSTLGSCQSAQETSSGNETADGQTSSSSESTGTSTDPITLTIWLHEGYVNNLKRWGVDPVSKWIQEQTGVTLDVSTGDGSNDAQKLTLLMASDSLPDIVNVPKMDPCSIQLQDEELVEDLDALAHEYNCETMIRLIDECNDISLQYSRFKDGNYWGGKDAPLYVWPDYFVDKFTYENARLNKIQERKAWLVRWDIYEAEGQPDLSNIDDFVAFLEKCATYTDTNGNAVTPLGLSDSANAGEPMQMIYSLFSGRAEEVTFDTGEVVPFYARPEFEDTMLFLNDLYRNKLLDQELYTETYDQWKSKMQAGSVGVIPNYYWHADGANDVLKGKNEEMFYQAIPADKVPKPDDVEKPILNHGWAIGVGFGWRCNFISKSSENKERAIQFLDFMSTHEAQMTAWYGLPGEYYEPAEAWDEANLPKLQDGSMVLTKTEKYAADQETYAEDFSKETGADNFWGFWCNQGYSEFTGGGDAGVRAGDPIAEWDREQVLALSDYDFELCLKGDVGTLATVDPDNKAIVDNIKRLQEKWYPNIVMATSQEEAKSAYDSMMAELETAGLSKLLASYDTIYEQRMLPIIEEMNLEDAAK
ncbi:MAG: extracellular solute-binding protein [Candidatus Merdivicinus sp.]|jgi:putative aldouronate transport system substrate-binding protein